MLGIAEGKSVVRYAGDYVVFDLETTGVSCKVDKVVELSAVKVRAGKVKSEFSTLVDPGMHIPERASVVNGITDDMVAGAPSVEEVLPAFLDFAGEGLLVGHNIRTFDMKFIYRDCGALFGKVPSNDYVDTLIMARRCLPALSHHRLTDVAQYYGISVKGAHRALADCRMNQAVYERLGCELEAVSKPEKICSRCGEPMRKVKGRYGLFWGCEGYPACKHTERIGR